MTISNLVGCCTGSSPGFAPVKKARVISGKLHDVQKIRAITQESAGADIGSVIDSGWDRAL
jgi:hypothetical protein